MSRRLVAGFLVVLAAALVAALVEPPPARAASIETRFTDDDWSVHETSINALAESGITKGCNPPANTRFCPSDPVTRAELAAFMTRAFGYRDRAVGSFVDDTGIFEADIERLAAAGITKGCNPPRNDRYCPDQPVTRGQMATMLARALGLAPTPAGSFVDIAASVHRGSIDAIAAAGITKGCNPPRNDRYCPERPVSRAEMATLLVRALELTPLLNRLSLAPDASCNREQTSCVSSMVLPEGATFLVAEGWYHALPFAGSEETEFTSSSTDVQLTIGGQPVPTTIVEQRETSVTTREWRAVVGPLSRGVHTLRVTWRWNGSVNRVAVVTLRVI